MADLNTTPASGSQVTTQNPQAAPSSQSISGASTKSGGVQPGTSRDLLSGQNGLTLSNSSLTTVNLGDTSAGTTVAKQVTEVKKPAHHSSTAFLAVSIILVVVAVAVVWAINRSAKNTTD